MPAEMTRTGLYELRNPVIQYMVHGVEGGLNGQHRQNFERRSI